MLTLLNSRIRMDLTYNLSQYVLLTDIKHSPALLKSKVFYSIPYVTYYKASPYESKAYQQVRMNTIQAESNRMVVLAIL